MLVSPDIVGFSFIFLAVFLLIGKYLRIHVNWLRNLFLPSSIIGGFVALIVGPNILGKLVTSLFGANHLLSNGLFPAEMLDVWTLLPGMFINIVFAALFLGQKVPSLKDIWKNSGPQLMMGYVVSSGQYIVGLLLTMLVLTPLFGMSPLAGALIEIAFVGGHGTAGGMKPTFEQLGYAEGGDLSLGLATIGILVGVICGIAIINIGFRKGYTSLTQGGKNYFNPEKREEISETQGYEVKKESPQPKAIEPLAFHFSLIAVAILIGYIILQALIFIEAHTWGAWFNIYLISFVPLFPMAMIGGIIVQVIFNRLNLEEYIDEDIISKISGLALDILLVSSLATLSLEVIGDNLIPFILISIVATIWNVFALLYLAPRMLPDHWFERALGDFGQATGMAATGLLLMKIADPEQQTPALEGFGYKQILFEPFVGGGIITSASLPLISQFGPLTFLIMNIIMFLVFLILGFHFFGPKTRASQ